MRATVWFIDIDNTTSYVANDINDALLRIMCHYLQLDHPTHMYSYIQLRETFCLVYGVPFSHKRTPDTLLDYIISNMPVTLSPDSNSLAARKMRGYNQYVAFEIPHAEKTLYANTLVEIYDIVKRFLFPNINPSEHTYLLTLSGTIGKSLVSMSKLDVVAALHESGYIRILEKRK